MGRFVEANTRKEVCMRLRRCIYDRKKILLYEIEETIWQNLPNLLNFLCKNRDKNLVYPSHKDMEVDVTSK
jgi:hypothetical protein